MTQDANSTKEFLTAKLKPIDLGVCLLPIIIGNSSNVTNKCQYPKCIVYSWQQETMAI